MAIDWNNWNPVNVIGDLFGIGDSSERAMSNNAVQRRAQDQKAAGINPLASGGDIGAASSKGGGAGGGTILKPVESIMNTSAKLFSKMGNKILHKNTEKNNETPYKTLKELGYNDKQIDKMTSAKSIHY